MRLLLFCTALFLVSPPFLAAQRQLEIEDLESWNRIEQEQLNADGGFTAYVLSPDKGDPTTVLVNNTSGKTTRFSASDQPAFSFDGQYLLMTRHPSEATARQFKQQNEAKKLKTMDTLVVVQLATGQLHTYPAVKKWQLGKEWSDFYAYTTTSVLADSLQKGLDKDVDRLVIRRLGSEDSLSLEGVKAFVLAEEKAAALAIVPAHDSLWTDRVVYLNQATFQWQEVMSGNENYAQPTLSKDGNRVAILANQDTTKNKQAAFHLYTWQADQRRVVEQISRNAGEWIPPGHRISDDGNMFFSDSGNKLYFGVATRYPEKDTSLIDEDIADVEVWTTQDARMYTQENLLKDKEQKRTYLTVYDWTTQLFSSITSPARAEYELVEKADADHVLVYDERAYLPRLTWIGGPSYKDIYLKNLETDEEQLIAKEMRGEPQWSPAGKYAYWYSYTDTAWFAFSVADSEIRQLTSKRLGIFFDEEDDHPSEPAPYGIAGWLENDEAVLIYDHYDWWSIDPANPASATKLTAARAAKKRLRYLRVDPEKEFFERGETVLVSHFDEGTYHDGYAWLNLGTGKITNLLAGPFGLGRPQKARQAEQYLFTQGDFAVFPDLQLAHLEKGTATLKSKLLSNANPQQKDFSWGSSELVQWTDNQGRELRGILIKPANFDPAKTYPLLVNFYERSSEGVYNHRAPYPHRSTINYSYYASRGYVIFNPDVVYRDGYPGESAYDCVMSGVTALLAKGFIDKARIGLQGHSWGGYQAAYLATKTDLFACIESGAPVVNMFSAYGGIRWGTGMSRQFQYERTQSRIGGTIWEYPLRYLENSPLFFTDKVNTPILIMHNDNDGAVPWYQGIEYFTALRRLGKPAWMLNYRGEPHWPLKQANRVDFQRRMSQFFDHYLQGEPRPRWMDEGVSPLKRGIEQGYETKE